MVSMSKQRARSDGRALNAGWRARSAAMTRRAPVADGCARAAQHSVQRWRADSRSGVRLFYNSVLPVERVFKQRDRLQ